MPPKCSRRRRTVSLRMSEPYRSAVAKPSIHINLSSPPAPQTRADGREKLSTCVSSVELETWFASTRSLGHTFALRGGGVGGSSKLWPIGCGVKIGAAARTLDDATTSPDVNAGTHGAAVGVGATSSSSQVLRTTGLADTWARSRSSAAHVGHPQVPRFIPHAQLCDGSPPRACTSGIIAGPSHTGAIRASKNASLRMPKRRCTTLIV